MKTVLPFPLHDWYVGIGLPHMKVLLEVQYARTKEESDLGEFQAVPLLLSASECRLLSHALNVYADKLDAMTPKTQQ